MLTPFLSFKGTTQAYLLKMSITHNKNLIPLLYLLNNYISAKSAPQILSLNAACIFLFSNFLIWVYGVLQLIADFEVYF